MTLPLGAKTARVISAQRGPSGNEGCEVHAHIIYLLEQIRQDKLGLQQAVTRVVMQRIHGDGETKHVSHFLMEIPVCGTFPVSIRGHYLLSEVEISIILSFWITSAG